jgi:hypothetical protein
MHLDVQDLRNFYYRRMLGRAVQAAIRKKMLEFWPEAKGQTVAGFGFALPLLRPYLGQARRVIALMPGPQGVMAWPQGLPNVATLCEETLWPIDTGRVDKLIVLHGLETSQQASAVLDECWRVLGPGGQALFVVPNRAGLWSRSDRTPFGFGSPYTLGQLEAQLKAHHFMIEQHAAALFQPPSQRRFWRRFGPLIERLGRQLPARFAGGVVMVTVSKRVQMPTGTVVRDGAPVRIKGLAGLAKAALPMPSSHRSPTDK